MQPYRRLLQYARPQRSWFLVILFLTITASALAALQPWPMKLLVDHVLIQGTAPPFLTTFFHGLQIPLTPQTLLVSIIGAGLLLFLLNSLLDAALTWSWTVAGRSVVYTLAEDLFSKLQRRSLPFHTRHSVGDILGRITVDCWAVHKIIDTLLFAPAHALLTIGAMIFLMSRLDGTLTTIALLTAPLMVCASMLLGKRLRTVAKSRREIETRIQSHIQQTLTGIPVVQSFAQEEREQAQFARFAGAAIRLHQRSALLGSINTLTSGFITTLGTGVILWAAARHVLDARLTIGSLLVFLVYLNSLQGQMKVLAAIYTTLQSLRASADRVIELLDAPPEVADSPAALPIKRARGHLHFEQVSFAYEIGRPVLRDLTLTVQPGEVLAIAGASGAGKTTLVSLLPRFFDPTEGRVLLDGVDVRNVRLRDLRAQISIVLQEPFLFPLSIADNIAYGRPGARREEIAAAAQAASAHAFIQRLPQGYDTVIGQRGGTLSGGERQRIAIARAFLKDAPILLLDEPTGALDAETEHSILETLERLMSGRTVLLIAHRLSTLGCADRIVVLENGRVAETGTHPELLARGGIYARFHHAEAVGKEQS